MKLDDLTIGEARQLAAMFGNSASPQNIQSRILNDAIGKYVICRTRNEGINCGKVIAADHTGVVLEDARRIYYHKSKDENVSWYEGVAQSGLHTDSKISGVVSRKYIIEDYSLTPCTIEAEQNLRNYVATGSN